MVFLKCGCFWFAGAVSSACAVYLWERPFWIAAGFAALAAGCWITAAVMIPRAYWCDQKADRHCPDCKSLLRRVKTCGSDFLGQ
jgi:hypothetical protein